MLSNNINQMTEINNPLDYYYKIKEQRDYLDGDIHGQCIEYYENGNIKSTYNYVDGEKNGRCVSYYESGEIDWESHYVDGKKHGKCICYYELTGTKEWECYYEDGEMHGEYIEYHENCDIGRKINYVNGKEHGKYIEYYKNGEDEGEEDYDPVLIPTDEINPKDKDIVIINYDKNGEEKSRLYLRNGKLVGIYDN